MLFSGAESYDEAIRAFSIPGENSGYAITEHTLWKINNSIPLSTEANLAATLNIYPNPVKDILFIGSGMHNTPYYISAISGKILARGTILDTVINFSGYQAGIYILQIGNNKPAKVVKL